MREQIKCDAIAAAHRSTAASQLPVAGEYYLVPREIIDQFPEININNYDHDDACALNAWGCHVVTSANPAPAAPNHQHQGEI